jgi:hypothetical protein
MNFIRKIRYWKKFNWFLGSIFLLILSISLWEFALKAVHNSYSIADFKVHVMVVFSFGFGWAFINIVDYLVAGLSNIFGRSD